MFVIHDTIKCAKSSIMKKYVVNILLCIFQLLLLGVAKTELWVLGVGLFVSWCVPSFEFPDKVNSINQTFISLFWNVDH